MDKTKTNQPILRDLFKELGEIFKPEPPSESPEKEEEMYVNLFEDGENKIVSHPVFDSSERAEKHGKAMWSSGKYLGPYRLIKVEPKSND